MEIVPILVVAIAGLFVGNGLDRLIRRLALYKSPLWPLSDHCERCYRPIALADKLPFLGYLRSQGRCRTCGDWLPLRRVFLELLTAVALLGLFYFHVLSQGMYRPEWRWHFYGPEHCWALFLYHSLLVTLLIVATFIDLDMMIIPDSVTVPGMLMGVILGALQWELHPVLVWEPPPHPAEVFERPVWEHWLGADVPTWLEGVRTALEPCWRQWWPQASGFWTGLAGLVVGGAVVWAVREVCSRAFRKEAMGMGDVMLMAMVGSFLGWQTVILAFFLSPITALLVGLAGWIFRGRQELPYGPHLSLSTVLCVIFWQPLWRWAAPVFRTGFLYILVAMVVLLALLFVLASVLQLFKSLVLGGAGSPEGGSERL